MEHILEAVLPQRFGGTPLDYQLMEEEDGEGFTRVVVVVSPRVGEVDEPAVVATVLAGLGASSLGTSMGGGLLGAAGALRVRRAEPTLTARGKLVPLHLARAGRDRAEQSERSLRAS